MISAEKHVAPSHREATTKACEQQTTRSSRKTVPHPDVKGKRGTSTPARQFGWQGRAGRGLPRRTGMRRGQLTNALLGALVKLQSQFRLRLFGVETASPHGQAVQHETGHEVRITIKRIVSTPMRTPPRVLTATSEQQNRPAM